MACPRYPWLGILLLALLLPLLLPLWTTAGEAKGIGTPHWIRFVAAAPDGRWVVIRQAREDTDGDGMISVGRGWHGEFTGDQMRTFFVRGAGEGEGIDAYVGSDPTGRYVAVVRRGRLVLYDWAEEEDLSSRGADARPTGFHGGRPRQASFDLLGRRMTWIRGPLGHQVVVVRELQDEGGEEHLIDVGEGLLVRADLTDDGDWVKLEVVQEDTDGDGKLTLPYPAPDPPGPPPGLFGRQRELGDVPVVLFAPSTGGRAREMPGLFCPLGDERVVRMRDWSLQLLHADGRMTPLVPGSAAALVQAFNPRLGAVVVIHTAGETKGRVEWIRGNERRLLPLRVERFVEESPRRVLVRFERPGSAWGVGWGRGTVLDYETGALDVFVGRVVALHGSVALVERDEAAVMRDVVSGEETCVDAACRSMLLMCQAGPMVAIDHSVFDLAHATWLGTYEGDPLIQPAEGQARAVRRDGRVLLVQAGIVDPDSGFRGARGPLRWVRPER